LLFFILGFASLARVLFFDLGYFNFAAFVKSADRTDRVRQHRGSAIFANSRRFTLGLEIISVIGARPGVSAPFFRYWHFLLLCFILAIIMHKIITINNCAVGRVEYTIAADELQILDVCVQPEYRRQGLAENALRELFKENPRLNNAYLEVRDSNQAALNLYLKLGFTKTGRRKDYYNNPIEDAVLLHKKLTRAV
jgi:ribosomal-protein-alanine N-acetyltransferase